MPSMFRRLRGTLGMATVWSFAWAPLGILWSAVAWLDAQLSVGREWLVPFPPVVGPMIMCAAWGFIAGAAFAFALIVAERHRGTLSGLSRRRTALWGALGGALLPCIMVFTGGTWLSTQPWVFLTFAGLSVALGATSAVSGVAVAQRAAVSSIPMQTFPELEAPAT